MAYILSERSDSPEAVPDAALIYRLQVPGALEPIKFQAASHALNFARVAFPPLAGRGLKAQVWVGKRIGSCEIWPINPHLISV